MPLERLNKLWQDLRRPLPPPPKVMLDESTGLGCKELREQVLVIGTPDETRQGVSELLRACAHYHMPVLALSAPGDPLLDVLPEGSVVQSVLTPAQTEQAVRTLFEWSQARSSRYTPEVWPFLLVVTPGLPEDALGVVLGRIPALRGHNFAVLACLTPTQVQPGMRGLFGNVVCWNSGLSSARQLGGSGVIQPEADQALLMTSKQRYHLHWLTGGGRPSPK